MSSRPVYKYGESSSLAREAYEMHTYSGGAVTSVVHNEKGDKVTVEDEISRNKGATANDRNDMERLGRTQELRRNFRFLSIFGYSLLLGNGWVLTMIGLLVPLSNGGTAGTLWMYLIVIFIMMFSTLSMAEMASMAPTAGGQYHWVSEFAPQQYQQFLSYLTGWLSVLGWQTALVSTSYSVALAVQGMIALNDSDYAVPAWHGVLLTVGTVLLTIVFNTVLLRRLPSFEGGMLVIHVFAFIAIFTVMWVMGDRVPIKQVFTEFSDPQGWGSFGLATLVGSVAASASLVGSDSAVHLGEELQDASWVLPRSMIVCAVTNYSLTFLMLITILIVKGGDVEQLIATPYAQPYVQIFYNVTQSRSASTALTALIFVLLIFGVINQVTTTSRQLWSFARDNGLPYSQFLSHVRPGWDIPLNAVAVTVGFSVIVSMIILGSPVAFFTLTSICNSALYASYMICIASMLWRRLSGGPMPPSRFNLGRNFGLFCNVIALASELVLFVFMFFPVAPSPDGPNFNWAILVFVVVVVWAIIYYYVWGRKHYVGPVTIVKGHGF